MNWGLPSSNLQASNIWFLSQSDGNISFYCKCFLLFSSFSLPESIVLKYDHIPQATTEEQQPLTKCWRWDKRGVHVWDERGHKSEMRGRKTSVPPAAPSLSFSRLRLSQRTDSAARLNESCAQLYTNPDIKIQEMLTSLFNDCLYKYFKLYQIYCAYYSAISGCIFGQIEICTIFWEPYLIDPFDTTGWFCCPTRSFECSAPFWGLCEAFWRRCRRQWNFFASGVNFL